MDKARQPTHGWARRGKQLLWVGVASIIGSTIKPIAAA
jgi:hypothetical protein